MDLAKKALEEIEELPGHKICLRLQAIASCASHPINTVSSVFGASRQTIWRWIRRFRDEGVAGLRDKPGAGRKSKLSTAQKQAVAEWLRQASDGDGKPVHWTVKRLSMEIERLFGVKLGKTPTWLLIRRLGFRQKVPRPTHAKSSLESREGFKKNS